MAKKPKKENSTKTMAKKIPFWLDPKAPLALDCELVEAVNKIIWKNIYRFQREITGILNKAGIFSCYHSIYSYPYGEILDLVNHDVDAAKRYFSQPPRATGDSWLKECARNCRSALKSRLIFVGVLSEAEEHVQSCEKEQYLTMYAIFRKPKTNTCFVAICDVCRERAKNLVCLERTCTTSSAISPSSSTASAGRWHLSETERRKHE